MKFYYVVHAHSLSVVSDSLLPYGLPSPPGSSVHGILQAKVLEWVAMPSSRGSSQPRDGTHISSISSTAGRFFKLNHQGSPYYGSPSKLICGLPGGLAVRKPPAKQETGIPSLGGEDPWRRKWPSTPVFLLANSHGQWRLVGCSPWRCKRVGHDLATEQP